MELKQWWQIIWKRRLLFFIAFIAVMVLAVPFALIQKPVYEATAKILIEQKGKGLPTLGRDLGEVGELSAVSRSSNPLETLAQLAKSDHLLERVIEKVDLRDPETGEPVSVAELLKRSRVATIKDTDILTLTVTLDDPRKAREVASVWAALFIEENQAVNRLGASATVRFIAGQIEKTKAELTAAETALRDFKHENMAIDLPEEARVSVQTKTGIEAEIRSTSASHREAIARANALRSQIGLSSQQALASTALSQDPTIQRLRQQLLEAETRLSAVGLAPDHPEVQNLQAHIGGIKQKLDQQSKSLLGQYYQQKGVKNHLDPVRQALTRDLIQAESQALANQTRLEALRRLAQEFDRHLANLPEKELQLSRLERKVAATSGLYQMLVRQHEEARIQAAMNISNASLVDEVSMPRRPSNPKGSLYLLAGLGSALVAGLGAVSLGEYLDDTIQTTEDAEGVAQVPVLGIIPWLGTGSFERLIARDQPRSPAAEAYRTLRTNIKFLLADGPRAFTITSAGSGEGKSTLVANLAIVFAQAGKRVLLVDADLRKPTIHVLFELPHKVGLTSVLRKERTWSEVIQRSQQENLDVLVCGPVPPDPSELLESGAMDTLIGEVKQEYDLILFDAPPIIAVADANILASRLDGLLLVIGVNRATSRACRHALNLLTATKTALWGTVVCGMRPENDSYYNSYYHRYYGYIENSKEAA